MTPLRVIRLLQRDAPEATSCQSTFTSTLHLAPSDDLSFCRLRPAISRDCHCLLSKPFFVEGHSFANCRAVTRSVALCPVLLVSRLLFAYLDPMFASAMPFTNLFRAL